MNASHFTLEAGRRSRARANSLRGKTIVCIFMTAVLVSCMPFRAFCQAAAPQVSFEAETQEGANPQLSITRCIYSLGKYYWEDTNSRSPGKYVFFTDWNDPSIIWEHYEDKLNPKSNKTYVFSQMYYYITLKAIALRDGAESVSKKYGIPLPTLQRFSKMTFQPCKMIYFSQLFPMTKTKFPQEKIAGILCSKYEVKDKYTFFTYWIDPTTNLVLKREGVFTVAGDPRAPKQYDHFLVTKIRYLKQVPAKQFQIPSGSVAMVPQILKDFPLPSGVTRKFMTGESAMVGIPMSRLQEHPKDF